MFNSYPDLTLPPPPPHPRVCFVACSFSVRCVTSQIGYALILVNFVVDKYNTRYMAIGNLATKLHESSRVTSNTYD